MAKLLEITVQETAVKYLEKKYYRRKTRGKMFADIELRTRRKYGGKRADGLLAFKHWLWGTFVVSVEAKSYKTLGAIRPYRDNGLFIRNCIRNGFYISLATGGFFALYKMDDGFWQYILPLNTFVLGGLLYGLLTLKRFKHKVVDVIEQVKQYPGNHQWLALSQDSLNMLSVEKLKKLETIAAYQGIGIVVVKSKKKAEVLIKPKMRWKFYKDFLIYYSKEKDIRTKIE